MADVNRSTPEPIAERASETGMGNRLNEADGRQIAARYLHAFRWEEGAIDPKPYFAELPPEYDFLRPLLESLAEEPAALGGFTAVLDDFMWETVICGAGPSNPLERYGGALAPPNLKLEHLLTDIEARMRAPVDPAFQRFMGSVEQFMSGASCPAKASRTCGWPSCSARRSAEGMQPSCGS